MSSVKAATQVKKKFIKFKFRSKETSSCWKPISMSKANRSLYIFSVNKSFLCSFIKVLKHIQVKEFTASEALQTWAKTNVCTERQSGFKKKEKKRKHKQCKQNWNKTFDRCKHINRQEHRWHVEKYLRTQLKQLEITSSHAFIIAALTW